MTYTNVYGSSAEVLEASDHFVLLKLSSYAPQEFPYEIRERSKPYKLRASFYGEGQARRIFTDLNAQKKVLTVPDEYLDSQA